MEMNTAQKRSSEQSEEETLCSMNGIFNDHSYDGQDLRVDDRHEFPELPATPSKPPLAKKPAREQVRKDNVRLDKVISDDSVRALAKLINSRSDALEKMLEAVHMDMQTLNEKVNSIEKRVEDYEVAGKDCRNRVSNLGRYGRCWNLILYGVLEPEKENVKENIMDEVTNICQETLPSEKEKLADAIDVAHRLGKNKRTDSKPRGIILRFISRRLRDAVWKAAKKNSFLQDNGLRFAEDLTKEDRDNRKKLWPKIKAARDNGKNAYFVGGKGFIEASEIHS